MTKRFRRSSAVTIRKRIVFLTFVCAVGAALVMIRLAYVQIARTQSYMDLALDQRLRGIPVDPRRGAIYDRSLRPLAVSVSSEGVYARPAEVTDRERTAAVVSQILGLPYEDVLSRLGRFQAEIWLKRSVSEEEARRIREADLPGVRLAPRTRRVYPQGRLAAHVLGTTGIDNQGLEGIELQYDAYLRGVPGRELVESDARGREIPDGLSRFVPARDGYDLVLTIDQAIQRVVEEELERAVIATQSDFGFALFMHARTGEILAMAVYPDFDPNDYASYPPEHRRNRAVADQFEPGSIFKVITGTAALAEGVVRADEGFFDPGRIEIGGGAVRCWRSGGHGSLNFVEAVEKSCNPVFAELGGLRLGPARFYRYVEAFGFGSRLGLDYPGEATGLVPRPGQVRHGEILQWANIGFGQGIAITPLQMVAAAGAIANGGVLMRPYLVREIRDATGRAIQRFEPTALRQVVAPAVAREFSRMMRSVVVNGSGRNADIPGYRVAGKTGTAQIPEGGVYTDKSMASFVAFAPVDDPVIVGMVSVYNLKVYPQFASIHAAPVWGRMGERILEYLGVRRRPDGPEQQREQAGRGAVAVPNVRNLPEDEARQILTQLGLKVRAVGAGLFVLDQVPAPGAHVPQGTAVVLEFYEVPPQWQGETTVPDVRGQTMREVARQLADAGLYVHLEGSGTAVQQDPAPGVRLKRGSTVSVRFAADPAENKGN